MAHVLGLYLLSGLRILRIIVWCTRLRVIAPYAGVCGNSGM